MTNSPSGSDEMVSAEQRVLAVYPEAFLYYMEQTFSECILFCCVLQSPTNRTILGRAQKERNGYEKDLSVAEAWEDAASKLPTPVESRPTEMADLNEPYEPDFSLDRDQIKRPKKPLDSVPEKGAEPEFKEGQVVWWGNGMGDYVVIRTVLPIHCAGGAQQYGVTAVPRQMAEFYSCKYTTVSEGVLRALTEEERGVSQPSPAAGGEIRPKTMDVERAENWLAENHPEFSSSRRLAEVLHDYSLTCFPSEPATPVAAKPVEEELPPRPETIDVPRGNGNDEDGYWASDVDPYIAALESRVAALRAENARLLAAKGGQAEKWDDVYRQCCEFIENPGEPSTKPIEWCKQLIEELRLASSPAAREGIPEWIEIKEGCELPVEETYCIIRTVANKSVMCGEGYWFQAGAKRVWRFTRWPGEVLKEKTITHWLKMPMLAPEGEK